MTSSAARGVWRLTAMAALVALAGCGGGSRDDTAAAGSTDSAITGSAEAPPLDTTAEAAPDSARADTAPSAQAKPASPKKQRDTAPPARATRPARDTAAGQDTAATAQATHPAQDTATAGQDTATGSQDTATAGQDTTAGQTQTADAPLRDAYHRAPKDTVSQEVYDGWKQYNLNCARCHGEDVLGTTIAPHLIVSLKPDGPINTKELFIQTVCAGRPEKGMPSWCALGMDMEKINQIYSYVKGRSEAKLHPGRPAREEG